MSALDAFFANGMSVYKPETGHLHTRCDFESAVPFLGKNFDEQGQPLRPTPEQAIRYLSIKWFLWQASLDRFHHERAPRSMKAIKIAIGNWCATAGRKDLEEKYKIEAEEEYPNFTFPYIAQASASLSQQCVPEVKEQSPASSSHSSTPESSDQIAPQLCAQSWPISSDEIYMTPDRPCAQDFSESLGSL